MGVPLTSRHILLQPPNEERQKVTHFSLSLMKFPFFALVHINNTFRKWQYLFLYQCLYLKHFLHGFTEKKGVHFVDETNYKPGKLKTKQKQQKNRSSRTFTDRGRVCTIPALKCVQIKHVNACAFK